MPAQVIFFDPGTYHSGRSEGLALHDSWQGWYYVGVTSKDQYAAHSGWPCTVMPRVCGVWCVCVEAQAAVLEGAGGSLRLGGCCWLRLASAAVLYCGVRG